MVGLRGRFLLGRLGLFSGAFAVSFRECKWLGSPPFISHEVKGHLEGGGTPVRGRNLTMVINHLLNGMILQACLYTMLSVQRIISIYTYKSHDGSMGLVYLPTHLP